MRPAAFLAGLLAVALTGCGSGDPKPEAGRPTDPYAGMTKEQKIEAIQNDPKITGMQKQSMLEQAQKGG